MERLRASAGLPDGRGRANTFGAWKAQLSALAIVLLSAGTLSVIDAAADPAAGLFGRRFEGSWWATNGVAGPLVDEDNIVLAFKVRGHVLIADTDCSNLRGTFRIADGRLFLLRVNTLDDLVAYPATPTIKGHCFDEPRRRRAENLDAFYLRQPSIEIRRSSLVLRAQGSMLVLTDPRRFR
jgi:hypothetical protein